jgi:hypothetical protein
MLAGVVAGLAFFAHSMVQNSHAWPLLWAFLAGVAAVLLAGRDEAMNAGTAVRTGAVAGAAAGLTFVLATSVALFALGVPQEAARELQGQERAAFGGLAISAGLGMIVAVLGAAAAYFAFRRRA